MKKIRVSQVVLNIVIMMLIFIMLYPLAMAVFGAFKNSYTYELTKWYPTLPLRVSNIASAFSSIWRYIANTVLVAGVAVSGSVIIASLASYAFAKMYCYGKKVLYMMVISLMMVPGVLTLVPSYMQYKSIVGLDNYLILIMPTLIGGPVFGVFLLRSFYEGIPDALFEAARIEGAGEMTIFTRICVPMSLPITGTLAIMQLLNVWNDYMWPIITIQRDELLTISAGLVLRFSGAEGAVNYPITYAAYLLASLPLIILFVAANKTYVEGLTSSAIKM